MAHLSVRPCPANSGGTLSQSIAIGSSAPTKIAALIKRSRSSFSSVVPLIEGHRVRLQLPGALANTRDLFRDEMWLGSRINAVLNASQNYADLRGAIVTRYDKVDRTKSTQDSRSAQEPPYR
jgi:hypothetical protein